MIFIKNSETGRFLFFPAHILAHMVFAYLLPKSSQPPLTFFSNGRVCQVTPRLKAHIAKNRTHYLFAEYFEILRSKK
jgi:hypothetical protein